MSNNFPLTAPLAPFQYYRSYARRKDNGQRESWANTNERTVDALEDLGLDAKEADLLYTMQDQLKVFCSGRWLWVGGTEWVKDPANYLGSYNCSSTEIIDIHSFAMQMSMAAMGCGTGTVLEPRCIDQLPPVRNRLEVSIVEQIGVVPAGERRDTTALLFYTDSDRVAVSVGDSRQGWVDAYEAVLNLAVMAEAKLIGNSFQIEIHLDNVRPAGEPLKGFGGVANPAKLTALFPRMAEILNEAVGRKLSSLECCLLLDEAASVIVAGNIRRSASIRQGASTDAIFAAAKDNLWQEKDGVWSIDPKRDALRMANHTRVFHHVPTQEEMVASVSKQFFSGEGAIMFAPEAIARASADIMPNDWDRRWFIDQYVNGDGEAAIRELFFDKYGTAISSEELQHRLHRYGLNPCAEVIGSDFLCNLSEVHLNQINPLDFEEQDTAFKAATFAVLPLLHHKFMEPRQQQSRELDPIIGVSFTGLFDFFVHAFGVEWLRWWEAGRPSVYSIPSGYVKQVITILGENPDHANIIVNAGHLFHCAEEMYLKRWKAIVQETTKDYCNRYGIREPNRCTLVQPAGSKSLLTGASSGWHPPKAQRFMRRMTFAKGDPVALAAVACGYSIVPSQSDKDENGNLLNDPFDGRCTEWLVEVPVEVSWANLPGASEIEIEKFSALAQLDFYMQVQRHYSTHTTSATIELTQEEIEPLANAILDSIKRNRGYISVALLARFDAPFPRLPFEKIDRDTYLRELAAVRERSNGLSFEENLAQLDDPDLKLQPQDAACEGLVCEMPKR